MKDVQKAADKIEADRAKLDDAVYRVLGGCPLPAIDVCHMLGLQWLESSKDLRASFLRLQEAGKADIVYGQGWKRVKP